MEFWPSVWHDAAPAHVAIALSEQEYVSIRTEHRTGEGRGDGAIMIADVAARALQSAAEISPPYFLRLGYGSWAGSQLSAFGSLEVATDTRAAEVLSLRDLRLAEIARRYVRGFTPQLFVRAFVKFPPQNEFRITVENRRVASIHIRHARAAPELSPGEYAKISGMIGLDTLNAFSNAGRYALDVVMQEDRLLLLDVNPAR